MLTHFVIVLVLTCGLSLNVQAAESRINKQTNTKARSIPSLSLKEAILLAMRNNPNIRSAELQRAIDKFALVVAHNEFMPQFTLTGQAFYQHGAKGSYSAAPTASLLTPLGTQITTGLTHVLNNDVNPPITTNLSATVTQPLLRGFGPAVTKVPWQDATDREKIAQLTFKGQVMTILVNVVNAFYNLVQAYNNLRVDQLSLQDTQTTLNQTLAKINTGKAAPAEKIQQQANIATQQLAISTDENAIRQNYQNLINLLGLDPDALMQIDQRIRYSQQPIPSLEKSMQIAASNNIIYLQALLNFKIAERALLIAKNNQLWQLNANATLDQPIGQNASRAISAKSLNFELDIPIRDLARKQELINAKTILAKDKIALAQLKRQLIIDVTNAHYNVQFSAEQVRLANNVLSLAQQSLAIAKIKFNYGKITSFELTSLQTALTTAQLRYIAQQIAYFNNLESFYQLLGTSLEKWGISVFY